MKLHSDDDVFKRELIGLAEDYPSGLCIPFHNHDRAQLLYASSGVMSVEAEDRNFVVPPQRALWIPTGVMHQVICRSDVSLRTLYFLEEPSAPASKCKIIEVPAFLRALIVEIVRFTENPGEERRERMILRLLRDEVAAAPDGAGFIKMPTDKRLLQTCRSIIEKPADTVKLDQLAAQVGMSRRSFTRTFKTETGVGLSVWRQQARLVEALAMLASGQTVANTAYAVGYDSPSAFAAIFRRYFGVTPRQFRSNIDWLVS
ncbi:MAG: helix-turn-helix transcriptional regulator [Pseudomonadota bacterium]